LSAVTFDTLKFVETLEEAGVERKQATAIACAVRDSHDAADLVTKKDLTLALSPIQNKLTLLHWMVGAALAGIGVVLAKLLLG